MKTQFNMAREMGVERDPFIQEILNMHAEMVNRYDPADLFVKIGRLLGFPRYISIERTDYSHFLLNSEWITSGVFTVGRTHDAGFRAAERKGAQDFSAFFQHSLWTTAGAFTLQA